MATKYPIILVHGVALKEKRYFRAFGKIQSELTKRGYEVYIADTDAFGTVESNSRQLKEYVEKILDATGAEKVNLIGHSKGGLDSKEMKDVHYVTYEDSVEQNLMALVLVKERLNEFIKTGEVKEQSEIFEEFDITMSVIDSLLIRSTDSEGKIHISWGSQRVTS